MKIITSLLAAFCVLTITAVAVPEADAAMKRVHTLNAASVKGVNTCTLHSGRDDVAVRTNKGVRRVRVKVDGKRVPLRKRDRHGASFWWSFTAPDHAERRRVLIRVVKSKKDKRVVARTLSFSTCGA